MNVAALAEIGAGGSVGAVTRFVIDGVIRLRISSRVPVGTVIINVTGSLLSGFITGLVLYRGVSSAVATVAATGFCGGFTTFSTAAFETVRLLQQRAMTAALVTTVTTVLGAFGGAAVALAAARL